MWTVTLQSRRLRSHEPEDGEFLFRRWMDFQFLIVALTRLRRSAALAGKAPEIAGNMRMALLAFDRKLPSLRKMRNVAEHFDDYALDQGRDRQVGQKTLEVGVISETKFQWLDCELDADTAVRAAQELFKAIQMAQSSFERA